MRKHLRAKVQKLGLDFIDKINALELTPGETVEFLDILRASFTETVDQVKQAGKLIQRVTMSGQGDTPQTLPKSARKPYNNRPGYVCQRKCELSGHIVIYDRLHKDGGCDIDADSRWVVMHEPTGHHVAVKTLAHARQIMDGVANAATLKEARRHAADLFPAL